MSSRPKNSSLLSNGSSLWSKMHLKKIGQKSNSHSRRLHTLELYFFPCLKTIWPQKCGVRWKSRKCSFECHKSVFIPKFWASAFLHVKVKRWTRSDKDRSHCLPEETSKQIANSIESTVPGTSKKGRFDQNQKTRDELFASTVIWQSATPSKTTRLNDRALWDVAFPTQLSWQTYSQVKSRLFRRTE